MGSVTRLLTYAQLHLRIVTTLEAAFVRSFVRIRELPNPIDCGLLTKLEGLKACNRLVVLRDIVWIDECIPLAPAVVASRD